MLPLGAFVGSLLSGAFYPASAYPDSSEIFGLNRAAATL